MPNLTQDELVKITDEAFATRLAGNELLKQGDYQGALTSYHTVLLRLKGLESQIQNAFGTDPTYRRNPDWGTSAEGGEPPAPKEPTLHEKVKTAIGLTYLNTAAIHIKRGNYPRALEAAQQALRIDETNNKAKFREAQAMIGLGEISKGRAALESLQISSPDIAITNALHQLRLDERARTAKSQAQFKGMYAKKPVNAAEKDSSSSVKLPPGLDIPANRAAAADPIASATITEIEDDAGDATGAATTTTAAAAGASATQPVVSTSETSAEVTAESHALA